MGYRPALASLHSPSGACAQSLAEPQCTLLNQPNRGCGRWAMVWLAVPGELQQAMCMVLCGTCCVVMVCMHACVLLGVFLMGT